MRRLNSLGFTLIEMLASLLVVNVVMAGAIGLFQTYQSAAMSQDQTVSLEQNLRSAMDTVTDAMRTSGFGLTNGTAVPTWVATALGVSGTTTNPTISGSSPATLTLVGCFRQATITLSAHANSGDTTLSVGGGIATNSVILLDDTGDLAQVTAGTTAGGSISIDTSPGTTGGPYGLKRAYPATTPVCVLDALTFSIGTDASMGTSWLTRAGGSNPGTVADGITNLQITTLSVGQQYSVTLTGSTQSVDPLTRAATVRSLQSTVTLRN